MSNYHDYRICTRCVMDTTDKEITFYDDGTCNHCNTFLSDVKRFEDKKNKKDVLDNMLSRIKEDGKNKQYDCIVGVSGGVDSTYVAYLAKELGLRPLAVHLDNGWNSELAVHNIEYALNSLGIDLHTVVLDWDKFRELQKSFLFASVSDAEIPTDHMIRAALWSVASKYNIKYSLNGRNHSTEGILPWSWTYNALDWKYISSVHRTYSKKSLRGLPKITLPLMLWRVSVSRLKSFGILDYVDYDKQIAMKVLSEKLNWRDYGGKHYESIYTRFFQGYILPTKFGIDKRRAHLSVLVCTGQISRSEALDILDTPPLPDDIARQDCEFVKQKLGLTDDQFETIMTAPIRSYKDFPNNSWVFMMHNNPLMLRLVRMLRTVGILPRGFGDNMLDSANTNKKKQSSTNDKQNTVS